MLDNFYFQAAKADYHRDNLMREAEQDRLLATQINKPTRRYLFLRERIGDFLIASGTRLKGSVQMPERMQPMLRGATK